MHFLTSFLCKKIFFSFRRLFWSYIFHSGSNNMNLWNLVNYLALLIVFFLASGGITKGGKIQLLAGKLFYQWGEVSYHRFSNYRIIESKPLKLPNLVIYKEQFSEKGNDMKKYSRIILKKWLADIFRIWWSFFFVKWFLSLLVISTYFNKLVVTKGYSFLPIGTSFNL